MDKVYANYLIVGTCVIICAKMFDLSKWLLFIGLILIFQGLFGKKESEAEDNN